MRLFISYASEDRTDFAEPLANELGKDYDVWFAPYELKVGDSLLKKISEGLASCDYGVVILSHHFFAKKWPTAELNGLFALEEPSKKVILPVWKGLTEDDVKKYSPILADRKAADGDAGVEAVVAALRLAVDASGRQRQLGTMESTLQRFTGLAETIKERQESAQLLGGQEGVRLVAEAAELLFDTVEKALAQLASTSTVLKFAFHRRSNEMLRADGNYRLTLHLNLRNAYVNTATSAVLTVTVIQDKSEFVRDRDWDILIKDDFRPSFRRGREVVWKAEGDERTLSTEELAAAAIEKFRGEFERTALSSS